MKQIELILVLILPYIDGFAQSSYSSKSEAMDFARTASRGPTNMVIIPRGSEDSI